MAQNLWKVGDNVRGNAPFKSVQIMDPFTDRIRLLFQPLLVLWALWATGAWRDRRRG